MSTAADVISKLTGDPNIGLDVEKNLSRRKKIDELVSRRAKANLTIEEVARRMRVTPKFVRSIEEDMVDDEANSLALMLYESAISEGA